MLKLTYILDSNVYGELLIDPSGSELIGNIANDKRLYVYGVDVIERELEQIPVEKTFRGQVIRDAVLSIYEAIVDGELRVTPLAEYLADKYFEEFSRLRKSFRHAHARKLGKLGRDDLKIDFQIIAEASLAGVDVVVSKDGRTILSAIAGETYEKVNAANGLRIPSLVKYSDFRKSYLNEVEE